MIFNIYSKETAEESAVNFILHKKYTYTGVKLGGRWWIRTTEA
ncbi:MAG: hypothetical protein Q4D57_05450 [Clostridia bacterium]|nr:hypothetical protein [Clostridia bacterium]